MIGLREQPTHQPIEGDATRENHQQLPFTHEIDGHFKIRTVALTTAIAEITTPKGLWYEAIQQPIPLARVQTQINTPICTLVTADSVIE